MDVKEMKQIKRADDGLVIVFDPMEQTLRTENVKNLNRKSYLAP
jgi:hypothetical protein